MEKYTNEGTQEGVSSNDTKIIELHNEHILTDEAAPGGERNELEVIAGLKEVVLQDGREVSLEVSQEEFDNAKAELERLRPEIDELFQQLKQMEQSRDKSAYTKFMAENGPSIALIVTTLTLVLGFGVPAAIGGLRHGPIWSVIAGFMGTAYGAVWGLGAIPLFEKMGITSKNEKIILKKDDLQKLLSTFNDTLAEARFATTRALLAEGASIEEGVISQSENPDRDGSKTKFFEVTEDQNAAARKEMESDFATRSEAE